MSSLRPVRGTHDIVGEDALRHRQVIETGRAVAARYGYAEVATPIFEFTEVFARTLGETSDVVTKEMYSFTDRGGERADPAARVHRRRRARASSPARSARTCRSSCSASGPMFRYERPQKGRLRQFHQIDVEVIGAPEPLADVEVIALGAQILRALGLAEQVRLELNTLGDPESRQRLSRPAGRLPLRLSRPAVGGQPGPPRAQPACASSTARMKAIARS